jgi:hypothetical protein
MQAILEAISSEFMEYLSPQTRTGSFKPSTGEVLELSGCGRTESDPFRVLPRVFGLRLRRSRGLFFVFFLFLVLLFLLFFCSVFDYLELV